MIFGDIASDPVNVQYVFNNWFIISKCLVNIDSATGPIQIFSKGKRIVSFIISVGGYGSVSEGGGGGCGAESNDQLMLSELPEPPIALSDIGPIPPPPMFSSPSPTRHNQRPHHHQHATPHHPPLSDCEYICREYSPLCRNPLVDMLGIVSHNKIHTFLLRVSTILWFLCRKNVKRFEYIESAVV